MLFYTRASCDISPASVLFFSLKNELPGRPSPISHNCPLLSTLSKKAKEVWHKITKCTYGKYILCGSIFHGSGQEKDFGNLSSLLWFHFSILFSPCSCSNTTLHFTALPNLTLPHIILHIYICCILNAIIRFPAIFIVTVLCTHYL